MLRHLVNIQHWLDNDPLTDWQARLLRDRDIQLSAANESQQDPLAQILSWWQQIGKKYEVEDIGSDVLAFLKWSSIFTGLIGALLGASAAMAVLRYDGSEPISVLVVLSVLVLAPLILLLGSLCLPFVKSDGLLGSLNLGSIIQSVIRARFSHLSAIFQFASVGMEHFLRWRLMSYSQIFGLSFAATALAVLLLKVTLTDLAFAWGTTLDIGPETIYKFLSTFSMPWASAWPPAAPDEALVVASKYYRLGEPSREVSAVALTGWWAFLAASLAFYGILLRGLLLLFSRFKASRALERAFLNHPQSLALLERLNAVAITSTSDESVDESPLKQPSSFVEASSSIDGVACVFLWHKAPGVNQATSPPVFAINREADLIAQKDKISEAVKNASAVRINCKGWEPPLLEFHDFLLALRGLIGAATALVVTPVDETGAESPVDDKNVWRDSLAKLDDPHLYVQ